MKRKCRRSVVREEYRALEEDDDSVRERRKTGMKMECRGVQ